jgi:hypothetical protein
MGKLCIIRGWRAILNVHERSFPVPEVALSTVLDTLAGTDDQLWPWELWPPMVLDRGLRIGSRGGHSLIRYHLTEYVPGKRIEFGFDPMVHLGGFRGRHFFEVIARPGHTVLRHTIDVEIDPANWIYWKVFIERIHDAVLEDAFDKVERHLGIVPRRRSRWSLYVRFLRWLRARSGAKARLKPAA